MKDMTKRAAIVKPTVFVAAVCMALCLVLTGGVAHAAADGHPVVVSMGDSYSSGEGIEDFYGHDDPNKFKNQDFLAHRSKESWPGRLQVAGETLKSLKDQGWYFVAASGAETRHVIKDTQDKSWNTGSETGSADPPLPVQNDVFADKGLTGKVDYVTMTLGGNDVGFAHIVEVAAKDDVPFVSVGNLKEELLTSIDKFDNYTMDDLLEVYSQVSKQAGSQAKIIVAGYPHLFPPEGREVKSGNLIDVLPSSVVGISADDARLINAAVDMCDEGISKIITRSTTPNLEFVDVRPYFNGHEKEYIHPIYNYANGQDLDTTAPSAYSVHPTGDGAAKYAEAVQEKIKELESPMAKDVQVDSDVAMSLVFDVSGSMNEASALSGMSKLASAKKQSTDFVSSVRGQKGPEGGLSIRVGVCSFSSAARTNCGLSNDPNAINESINALQASGQTNMYAGLGEGIDQLMGEDGPRVMVFLSDGMSNLGGSRSEILALADQAAANDIKIYTIGFGPSGSLDEDLLQKMATRTGGSYSHEDSSDISSAAVGLFATMMNARLAAAAKILNSKVSFVQQGATDSAGTFDITKNGTVQVYLYWPGSALDMQLTDPAGTKVAEGYAGCTIDTSSIPTLITIENAKQGTWSMDVYGREVSMEQEPYYAVAAFTETQESAPAATGAGGGSSSGGEGLMFLVVAVAAACIVGVIALAKRRGQRG